jgi:hypothetical protein
MNEETSSNKEEYTPLFELGLYGEDPAIKIVNECSICPTSLASLVTALFETVMRTVSDKKQIQFEEKFNDALQILMKERFNYDISIKFPEDEN